LTTIAEKSLGAVAKAGSTAMTEVYEYAEPMTKKGFVFMDTPGFDPPSVTGLVASPVQSESLFAVTKAGLLDLTQDTPAPEVDPRVRNLDYVG